MRREDVGSAERPLWAAGGAFGALEGCGRNRHAFLLILRFLSALCAAACVHLFFQTVLYTVVCVFFACGSGKKAPLHPLPAAERPPSLSTLCALCEARQYAWKTKDNVSVICLPSRPCLE